MGLDFDAIILVHRRNSQKINAGEMTLVDDRATLPATRWNTRPGADYAKDGALVFTPGLNFLERY
jgi:hypothetical protein